MKRLGILVVSMLISVFLVACENAAERKAERNATTTMEPGKTTVTPPAPMKPETTKPVQQTPE